MIKAEIQRHKNGLDFSVKVSVPNKAPQIFNNLPVINCFINLGLSEIEIKNAVITDEATSEYVQRSPSF